MVDEHGDLVAEILRLRTGIRKLRDDWVRGDDKCWKDLVELFQILPEGFIPPAHDTRVELANCEKYIASCHHPDVTYTSPQRRIEELEKDLAEAREREADLLVQWGKIWGGRR